MARRQKTSGASSGTGGGLVTGNEALRAACERMRGEAFIALDTEFHRETTFWPRLCLIQAATSDFDTLIDPLAEGLSLDPFLELVADPGRTKVMHGARQDMEIFTRLLGVPPGPLFDTQIAAMACGHGDGISYDALVASVLGRKFDKGARFTDWTRRPLSDEQLHYARRDVTGLREIYPILRRRLDELGREEWIAEEIGLLVDTGTYDFSPERAWRRLKPRKSGRTYRSVLAALAAWRERQAQDFDKPRGRILKDDALHELALRPPRTADELDRTRLIPAGYVRSRYCKGLFETVRSAADNPEDPPWPPARKPPPRGSALADLLRVLLKHVGEQAGIAPRLIASAEDLDRIAAEDEPEVRALNGWRYDLFGKVAMELKRGRLALAAGEGTVRVVEAGKP